MAPAYNVATGPPPNVTTHSGLWATTYASFSVTLVAFVARLSDADRVLFKKNVYSCQFVGVDFEVTTATESTETADDLDMILGVGLCLSWLATAAHVGVLVLRSMDPAGVQSQRTSGQSFDVFTKRTGAAYVVAMESPAAIFFDFGVLAYIFVCLGYAYTLTLTTTCNGGWAAPKLFEVVGVCAVMVAFLCMFRLLMYSLVDKERNGVPTTWSWHVRRGILGCLLAVQFGFAVPFFKDFSADDADGCTRASTNDTVSWVLLCTSLGSGLLWAVMIFVEIVDHAVLVVRGDPDTKGLLSGRKLADRTTDTNEQIHQHDGLCVGLQNMVWFRRFEVGVFFVHLLTFAMALNAMHLTRVVDVECTPLAFKMASASKGQNDKHWELFGMIMVEFAVFAYTLGLSAAAHLPVLASLRTSY